MKTNDSKRIDFSVPIFGIRLKSVCIVSLLIINALFISCKAYPQGGGINIIYIPAGSPVEVSDAAKDMGYWLEKATGRTMTVQEGAGGNKDKGIHLQLATPENTPAAIRGQINRDGQSFYLVTNGYENAVITGTGSKSLVNGIYTFLQELGFRWYMPGDAWAIVPDLSKKNIKVDKVFTPDFQDRYYAGSGGAAAIPGLDPDNQFIKDFRLWNRRNRISQDYAVKGHSGMAFYSSNKKEMDQHPEYFCNNKINKSGRINIANGKAVDLFVNWALNQVAKPEPFPLIGVDPADGSGQKDDCLPAGMPAIKTWSDKYFWLANQVAQKLDKRDTLTRVQLYAYSQHADVPGFELEKNVYPVIIPYVFQNVTEPDLYIRKWAAKMKGRPMGVYDYWNITQWDKCLPKFNFYAIQERLRFWKQQGIKTIHLESTFAKGPMGLPFWIASQMMWDTNLSLETLYREFLDNCFGKAGPDIRNMYDRWAGGFQEAMEFSISARDLSAASKKVSDKAAQQRISELKAYVQYIALYYQYSMNLTKENYERLINYIYSIHHLRLLHTSALQQYYISKPKGYAVVTDKKVIEAGNKKIRPLTTEDINANFERFLKAAPTPYTVSRPVIDITKAVPAKGKRKFYNPVEMISKNNYRFVLKEEKSVEFKAGATGDTWLYLRDIDGKIWVEETIKASKDEYKTIKIKLPAGDYKITFGALYRTSRLIFPEDIVFFSSDHNYNNSGYPLLYIYVPKDVTEIVYQDAYGPGTNRRGNLVNPDDEVINPDKIQDHVYRVPVPPMHRGKVWIFNMGHRSFTPLNIPDVFSLNLFNCEQCP